MDSSVIAAFSAPFMEFSGARRPARTRLPSGGEYDSRRDGHGSGRDPADPRAADGGVASLKPQEHSLEVRDYLGVLSRSCERRHGRRWQVTIWYRWSCRTARPAAPGEPSAPAAACLRGRTRESNAGIVFNDGGEHGDLAARLERRLGADAQPACRRADLLLRRSAAAIDNRHASCDLRVGRPNPRARASHPRNRPRSSEPHRVALTRMEAPDVGRRAVIDSQQAGHGARFLPRRPWRPPRPPSTVERMTRRRRLSRRPNAHSP